MNRRIKRWWPALTIPVVAVAAFALGWWAKPQTAPIPFDRPQQVTAINTEVGLTEASLRKRLGKPIVDKAGNIPLVSHLRFRPGTTNAARTLCFNASGGKLWCWLELKDETWICFTSFWHHDQFPDDHQLIEYDEEKD